MSEVTDFDKLLNDINRLNEQDQQDVYILTKNKNVPFKPLTLKQQKNIITSTTNESPTVEFVNVVDQIIKDNCLDFDIELYNCDRALIVLQMRSMAVGPELTLYNKSGDEMLVNIDEHMGIVRESNKSLEKYMEFTVKNDNIKIQCAIPSIDVDSKINKQFNTTKNKDQLDQIVGDVYVYETLKYIKTISTQQVKLNFHEQTDIESQIKIIESMPVSICSEIVKNIKTIREIETECLRSEALKGMLIPVDATIFTGE